MDYERFQDALKAEIVSIVFRKFILSAQLPAIT